MTKSLPTVSNLILEGNLDTCIHNIFQGWVCNCHMMVWYTGHWYIAWSVLLRTCIGSIVHRTREWTNAHFALRFQNSLDMTINCLQLKLLMKQSYLICGADDSWVRKCQLTYHDTLKVNQILAFTVLLVPYIHLLRILGLFQVRNLSSP